MTNLENLKKLAEGLGADASGAMTNLGALNVISAALGGSGDAQTNAEAIEDIAQAAPAAMEQNVVWADGLTSFFIPPNSLIKSLIVPDGVTEISSAGFGGWGMLETVVLPDTVQTIGSSAFAGCAKLKSFEVPVSVKRLESSTFGGCKALAAITLNANLEYIGESAFGDCTALTKIEIPASVTEIAEDAFNKCTNLTEININKPENSISGAPWGASNATVNWLG